MLENTLTPGLACSDVRLIGVSRLLSIGLNIFGKRFCFFLFLRVLVFSGMEETTPVSASVHTLHKFHCLRQLERAKVLFADTSNLLD